MADEKANEGGTAGAGEGGKAQPAAGAAGGTEVPPKGGAATGAAGVAGGAQPAPPTAKIITGDEDDDDLEAKAKYEVTGGAFKKRIDRASKAQLKDLFGTDDKDKITKDWQRYQTLEKKSEDDRRAKLDETTKLKEDNTKLQSQLAEVTARAEAAEEATMVGRFVEKTARIAGKHIDGDYVEDVIHGPFKRHVQGLSERERERFDDKAAEAWFAEYAKEKPKFARDGAAGSTTEAKVDAKPKVLANNGVGGARPAAAGSTSAEKTPRPGMPNSMTPAEYKKYKEDTLRAAGSHRTPG